MKCRSLRKVTSYAIQPFLFKDMSMKVSLSKIIIYTPNLNIFYTPSLNIFYTPTLHIVYTPSLNIVYTPSLNTV